MLTALGICRSGEYEVAIESVIVRLCGSGEHEVAIESVVVRLGGWSILNPFLPACRVTR